MPGMLFTPLLSRLGTLILCDICANAGRVSRFETSCKQKGVYPPRGLFVCALDMGHQLKLRLTSKGQQREPSACLETLQVLKKGRKKE